jgi:hypothetical protein
VHVSKGAEKLLLVFDKDGDFVKHQNAASPPKSMHDSTAKHR